MTAQYRIGVLSRQAGNASSSSTDAVIDPSSFLQSIPLTPLPRRLTLGISMGEGAMQFKLKHESCSMRNLWESNAFGYFGHTATRIVSRL
jgi:hypothetical protein